MKHGFFKLAAAVPAIRLAAPTKNTDTVCELFDRAAADGAAVLVFPELTLTGATCGDLFRNDALLRHAEEALGTLLSHSIGTKMLTFAGLPVRCAGGLYNGTAVFSDGKLLGVVPKQNPQQSREPADARFFDAWPSGRSAEVSLCGQHIPMADNLLFVCEEWPSLCVGCEIGSDAYLASPPSERLAAQGACVLVHPAADAETVGAEAYRRMLVQNMSGRLVSAYVSAGAGMSESSTDFVCAGHTILASNGRILAENPPFGTENLRTAVVDAGQYAHDRMRLHPFDGMEAGKAQFVPFSLDERETDLTGVMDPSPFLPASPEERRAACGRILAIQAQGLARRIEAAYAKGCVVALSGGLDSTLALIVTVRAMDLLGRDHREITTVTMPCFGTTSRTRSNAEKLAAAFGTSFRCIDIKEAVDLHFRDIGHDPADLSVVYENAQARERTQIIMDIANADGSLVIGTGDLSELALGWATYNGDHMSSYGVNGGVPKTLVRHVVAYYADLCEQDGRPELAEVFRDVLATPVSPELLPAKDGEISQKTEDIVGPYDLHDFFLWHLVRWGEEPEKVFREAKAAFAGQFDEEVIRFWLNTFLRRFYSQQFKRSALPDGPMVGSVAFSPRGSWKMPSDACGWEMKI